MGDSDFRHSWRMALKQQRLNTSKLARYVGCARQHLHDMLSGKATGKRTWPLVWEYLNDEARELIKCRGLYEPLMSQVDLQNETNNNE